MSINALSAVTVYVTDQDEALTFYRDVLGLPVRDDISFPNGFRWLSVGVPGQDTVIMLEDTKFSSRSQQLAQAVGGNSTWVFSVDDCAEFIERLRSAGTKITSEPTDRPYGIEAVIEDPFGNSYALVQRANKSVAYVISTIDRVADEEAVKQYAALAGPAIEQFGGRFLVSNGEPVIVEGESSSHYLSMVEFPSLESAHAWYLSPQNAEARVITSQAFTGRVLMFIKRS